jgi:hypothetical protein
MRLLARPHARPLHALFALWFAIVLGDPGVLHACPMHGGHGAAPPSAAAAATAAAAAAAAAAGHQGHSAQMPSGVDHSVPDSAQHPDSPVPCTCVGHCAASSTTAAVPAAASVLVPGTHLVVQGAAAPAPSRDVPASPDLRLPFANGPPTA